MAPKLAILASKLAILALKLAILALKLVILALLLASCCSSWSFFLLSFVSKCVLDDSRLIFVSILALKFSKNQQKNTENRDPFGIRRRTYFASVFSTFFSGFLLGARKLRPAFRFVKYMVFTWFYRRRSFSRGCWSWRRGCEKHHQKTVKHLVNNYKKHLKTV